MARKTFLGLEELKHEGTLWRCMIAEFLGTLLLVFIATGGCTLWGNIPRTPAQVAFVNGFTVMALITALGHVSGCQINPAVSICFLISGHNTLIRTLLFIPVQLFGATVGSLIVKYVTPEYLQGTLCTTSIHPALTPFQGVLTEAIATFVLLLVVQATSDEERLLELGDKGPLAVGLAVTTDVLWSNEYTGASMNPARSSGPALASNTLEGLWIYWVGPILGGIAATLLYMYVFKTPEEKEELKIT
uniref:Aquaporin n=1 Tax=Clastoptera arizonana TaxID=38151 RepID=A0A1B6DUK6_9HEMI